MTTMPWARLARLLLVLAVAGCGGGSAAAASDAPAGAPVRTGVDAVTVESVTVATPLALPSQLHVERDAWVAARADGPLDSLGADIGTRVGAGATLARIEGTAQQLALERAEVERAAAERLVLRARALTRAGGVTAADSDAAELALRRRSMDLAESRRALALTQVTAPFAGVVSARRARHGQLVRAGDTLFRVTQAGPLLARVNVPEALATTLRPGMVASVRRAAGDRRASESRGVVLRLAPAVDAASGTREVVLRVDPAAGLLAGSGVIVELGGARRKALAVPRTAVSDDGYALVLQDGAPTLRAVLVGDALDGGRVEVLGGLAAGERVARIARMAP